MNKDKEPIIIDDYNQRIPEDQEVIGTVTTQFGNSAPRHGYKIAEPISEETEKTICLNSKVDGKQPSLEHRIYDCSGISTAITTGFHPNIAEPLRIPQATAQGYVEVEPGSLFDGSYPNSKTRRGRVQDNGQSSPTLTANGEPPYYYEGMEEPSIINPLKGISGKGWHFEQQIYDDDGITRAVKAGGGSGNIPKVVTNNTDEWKSIVGNKQLNPFRGSVEEISPCITSACGAGGGMTPMLTDAELETTKTKDFIEQVRGHQPMNYRIRKLTPRECFRLMGVSESDIDKIQAAGISNSQQYKMAGNSIVVDVLEHLLKNLFVDTDTTQIDNDRQMRLF